jgi:hypothetical protein
MQAAKARIGVLWLSVHKKQVAVVVQGMCYRKRNPYRDVQNHQKTPRRYEG